MCDPAPNQWSKEKREGAVTRRRSRSRPRSWERDWSALERLNAWGQIVDSARGVGLALGSGESRYSGASPDEQAAMHIELQPGFTLAEPVLVHHFVRCQPVRTFPLVLPGEGLIGALIRLGWMEFYDLPYRRIAGAVLDRFVDGVAAIVWRPTKPDEDEDEVDEIEEIIAEVEAKHGRPDWFVRGL